MSVGLEINDRVRNPWGILHGGATAVLVDAAATHTIGPDAATADVVLHFLRPGRVGPAIARTSILGRRRDGHLLRVEVVDAGAVGPGHGRRRGDRAHTLSAAVPSRG